MYTGYTKVVNAFKNDSDNHQLFEILVARYQEKLLRYIKRLTGDAELSADILQEIFLAVYAILVSRNIMDGPGNQTEYLKCIQPLIYTIARNKSLDELRRRQLIRFVPIKPLPYQAETDTWQEDLNPIIEYMLSGPVSKMETQVIIKEQLKNAIEQVGRRKLLNLFLHLDGFSYKEIGQLTGDSMSCVKSKIYRSKQSLRQVLENN